MFEFSGERYIEARCEQVWMVVDDRTCLSRWLDFPDQIQDVTVYEHSRRVSWNTQEHPAVKDGGCANCLTVELIPDGAGTRVRILATREPSGPIQALAMRVTAQRSFDRHIRRSLEQLAQMLAGRTAG
jgi:carbon monoxide dehydrogenase subunit G